MSDSSEHSDDMESEKGEIAPEPKRTCFIVSPIGDADSEIRRRSDQIKNYIIEPAVSPYGYVTERSDLVDESGIITTQIVDQLLNADLVVADLAGHNPNVLYELAIRHTVGKPFVQLAAKGEKSPFDVAGQRTIFLDYKDLDSANDAKNRISRAVKAIVDGGTDYKSESPVSHAVDLQSLRSSGNPEQITLADVSESLTEIRTELRLNRVRASDSSGFNHQQANVVRKVLFAMALDGRLMSSDLDELESVPATKTYSAFLEKVREEMAKPAPGSDPWGSAPSSSSWGDDEPPF